MEKEKVAELIGKMRSDPAFRDRVLAVKDVDARMNLVRAEGFDCKINDVQLYMHHYTAADGSESVVLTEKGGCNGIWYGFCF